MTVPDSVEPVLVHLAGPLRVRRGGSDLTAAEIGSRKGRTLLRLLAARRGDVLSSSEVIAVLWPADPPADPDAVVASLVSRLRRVLGAGAVLGGREGYRWGSVETDVDQARRLLEDAERDAPAPGAAGASAAVRLLEAGCGPAEEADDEWAGTLRAEVSGLRRRGRHVLARAALELGDAPVAEDAARSALGEDPLDEEAVRLLMRALIARGLPAEALRVYDGFRRSVADELGTDPAPDTRRLYAAALQGSVPSARSASPDTPPPAPRADRLALAGREPELAALRSAWGDACRHRAGLVLLAGEPGIGKSRLLDELAGIARRSGGGVLAGRAFDGERSLFAQPVVDALASAVTSLPAARVRAAATGAGGLARLVPELAALTDAARPEPAPAAVDASQSFAAVAQFLRGLAREGPILLLVDDLQRAGRSTVELLHYLVRHLASEQLLIAAAARTGEGAEVLDVLGRIATTVPLGPLPVDAVALLAGRAGHGSRAADVVRRTGGHPLFVVEVLRALTDGDAGLPASLQTAVIERVARTGEETARLMRAAAVLGSAFEPLTAAALAGLPAPAALQAFERALTAALLVERGQHYEFAHDVVREALLAATPSPTRLAWHARAADLLSADPEAVAAHAEAVGDRARAARAWLRAAERALARFAATDALQLAGRAIGIGADLDDDELLGRALVVRGRAHEAAANFAAALEDFTSAREAARRAGDRRLLMTVLRELAGDVPVALGRPPADCEPLLDDCRSLAESLGDRAMEADVLGRLAVLRCSQLNFTGARDLAVRSLSAGRAAGDERAVLLGLDAVKTTTAYLGLAAELAPVVDDLEPRLRRRGELWLLQWTVFESAVIPLAAGDHAGALARIDTALDVCRRSGYTTYEAFFLAHRGWVHRLAGRLDDARTEGRRAVDLGARHGHTWWSTTAASLYAGTLLACGEPAAAEAVLRPAERVADVPGAEAYLLRCLGPLAEATGDPEVLRRADALLGSIRVPEGCAWLLGADAYLGVARAWRGAGRPDSADRILSGFRAAAVAAGWPALAELPG
ncbi:MAG: transcriptional regulator, putative ATPase, winged helix family [Blastococcus sp.]|nr:transcriptional regulator, putative ATPase, winged helix family [Blastococcus sp.]